MKEWKTNINLKDIPIFSKDDDFLSGTMANLILAIFNCFLIGRIDEKIFQSQLKEIIVIIAQNRRKKESE